MGWGTGLGFRLWDDATASFAVEFRLEVLFLLGFGLQRIRGKRHRMLEGKALHIVG